MKSCTSGERSPVTTIKTLELLTGINADYYIAVGYIYSGMYEFPVKKFYWALSKDFEFSELPELNDQHKNAVNYANAYFEGNPKKILVKVKKEGEGKYFYEIILF